MADANGDYVLVHDMSLVTSVNGLSINPVTISDANNPNTITVTIETAQLTLDPNGTYPPP